MKSTLLPSKRRRKSPSPKPGEAKCAVSDFDRLLDLATRIRPDGGMPGDTDSDRLLATCLALLAFLRAESTAERGPFQEHVRRLLTFLEQTKAPQAPGVQTCVRAVIRAVETGTMPPDEPWLDLLDAVLDARSGADRPRDLWQRVQKASFSTGNAQ